MQDFIEGPFDETIKTANFPILTSIVGSAFGGNSPSRLKYISLIWQEIYKYLFTFPILWFTTTVFKTLVLLFR